MIFLAKRTIHHFHGSPQPSSCALVSQGWNLLVINCLLLHTHELPDGSAPRYGPTPSAQMDAGVLLARIVSAKFRAGSWILWRFKFFTLDSHHFHPLYDMILVVLVTKPLGCHDQPNQKSWQEQLSPKRVIIDVAEVWVNFGRSSYRRCWGVYWDQLNMLNMLNVLNMASYWHIGIIGSYWIIVAWKKWFWHWDLKMAIPNLVLWSAAMKPDRDGRWLKHLRPAVLPKEVVRTAWKNRWTVEGNQNHFRSPLVIHFL